MDVHDTWGVRFFIKRTDKEWKYIGSRIKYTYSTLIYLDH